MTHPIVPEIIELATPLAKQLGLELVDAVFQTNKNPPVLRINIRNLETDTSLDDCENMSRVLEELLDTKELIAGNYVLEISSPGVSRKLTTDRDFISFKSFPVIVTTLDQQEKRGNLLRRDEKSVYLNQKGKMREIPREEIASVQLEDK